MNNNFFYRWLLMSIIIFVVSCTSPMPLQRQTSTVNANNILETTIEMKVVTTQVTITSISTLTATNTYTPTATSTPLLSTVTVTIPATLTPIPTLNSVEEGILVQEFMATNGGCQLPCWWGFKLGESLESIGEAFITIGIGPWRVAISGFGDGGEQGYIKLGYFDSASSTYNIGISMDFYATNNIVELIEVTVERPLRQYGEEMLVRDWEKYSLNSILQKYGKPPYVYLIPQNVADLGPSNYVLILYYPDLGFKFSYQPYETSSSDTETELCLNLGNIQQISLSLYNPEFVYMWANYLLPPALNLEAEDHLNQWTWEAQTGMDLNSFYETYKDPNNLGCIQVQ